VSTGYRPFPSGPCKRPYSRSVGKEPDRHGSVLVCLVDGAGFPTEQLRRIPADLKPLGGGWKLDDRELALTLPPYRAPQTIKGAGADMQATIRKLLEGGDGAAAAIRAAQQRGKL
jgi:hypothetical protein